MAVTVRLQVDILKNQLEELEKLQELGGLRSKRELWDTAFALAKWAVKKKAQGWSVGSMSPDGVYRELETHFLETCAANLAERHARSTAEEKSEDSTANQNSKVVATGTVRRRPGSITVARRRKTA